MDGCFPLFRCDPGILSLFASRIKLHSLMELKEGPCTIPELALHAPFSVSSFAAPVRDLIRDQIVCREGRLLRLTGCGEILAGSVKDFIDACGSPGCAARGERSAMAQRIIRSPPAVNLLCSLQAGLPQEKGGSTSPAPLHRGISLLHDAGLIVACNGSVALSDEGKSVVMSLENLLAAANLLVRHREFWMYHTIDNLPEEYCRSLGCLHDADIVGESSTCAFRTFEHFTRIISRAESIMGVSAWMSPGIAAALAGRVRDGVPVDIVVTADLLRELSSPSYAHLIDPLHDCSRFRLYVTHLPVGIGLIVTPFCLSCGFFSRDTRRYDCMRDLVSRSERAIRWGRDLFTHYRTTAVPVDPSVMVPVATPI